MSQAGSGYQAPGWFGMVDGRQPLPLRTAVINRVIVKAFLSARFLDHLGKFHSCTNCRICQRIDRLCIEQPQTRLLDGRDSAAARVRKLDQAHVQSMISKFLVNDSSLIVSPSPGAFSLRSMNPSLARGSPSK